MDLTRDCNVDIVAAKWHGYIYYYSNCRYITNSCISVVSTSTERPRDGVVITMPHDLSNGLVTIDNSRLGTYKG